MTKHLRHALLCTEASVGFIQTAIAQDAPPAPTISQVTKLLDFSVPDSPAFVILGVSPDTITRPNTLKALAVSLKGIDDKGKIQKNAAIDCALSNLFGRGDFTFSEYRKDKMLQMLRNTHLSVGTAGSETANDPAVRLAVGLHYGYDRADIDLSRDIDAKALHIFDKYKGQRATIALEKSNLDKAIALEGQAEAKAIKALESLRPDDDGYVATVNLVLSLKQGKAILQDRKDKLETQLTAIHTKIDKEFEAEIKKEQANEGKNAFGLAIAPCWLYSDGTQKTKKSDGYGAWASYSMGQSHESASSQWIAHFRIRTKERMVTSSGTPSRQNTQVVGARYRFGGSDFKLSMEAALVRQQVEGTKAKNFNIIGVVLEPHISQDIWATFAINRDTSGQSGPVGFRTSFKYGFN